MFTFGCDRCYWLSQFYSEWRQTSNLDPKTNAEIFKDFYSNLANNLVKKLPTPPNKYGKTAVNNYYKKLNLKGKSFSFAPVASATILKLLKQLNSAKSAGIDNLTGKFLKQCAPVLSSPITDLVNLSISLSLFPYNCKIAKLTSVQEGS